MTASRRKRLQLNPAEIHRLGVFLTAAGEAHIPGAGRIAADDARLAWNLMDSHARAAVKRLGLVPQLTNLGCIPATK